MLKKLITLSVSKNGPLNVHIYGRNTDRLCPVFHRPAGFNCSTGSAGQIQQERIHYQAYVNESLKERDCLVSAEEKGREEGREEGERKKSLEIAKKMLAKGTDLGNIEELTGLSVEEISRLRSQ